MYGVEKYIEKCLISCINQGEAKLGEDYEIVCINDGSPDKSADIAKRIANEYDGIRVIDQENQGLSGARNTGIDVAKGEYVWFVDSDDYIEEKCMERILPQLTDNLDILHLQYRHVYEDGRPPREFLFRAPTGVFSGKEITEQGGLAAPAQFSILRSTLLRKFDLKFVRGIYHEDSEFKPRAVLFANKIAFDTAVSYNYLQRGTGSIMSSFNLKRAEDILFVNRSLFIFSRKFDKRVIRAINSKIGMNMNSLFAGYHLLSKVDKYQVRKLLSQNKDFFECMKDTNNRKYRFEGYIFSTSISLGIFIHKLLK